MARPRMIDASLLVLRVSGALMAWHGWGKALAFFERAENNDWSGFVSGVGKLGFPAPEAFALAATAAELLGGLMVALGVYTRFAAAAIAFTMVVAAFGAHKDDPFSAKEKAIVYLIAMVALAIAGGGKHCLDRAWRRSR